MTSGPEPRRRQATRVIGVLCKTGLSVFLIWWVVGSIDLGRLRTTVAGLAPAWMVLAAVVVALQTVILGWRWHRIVRFLGGSLPPGKAIHWVFVGLFFNQALPTSIGGDVVRIWNLHRRGSALGTAFGSVAIERGTGIVILGLLVTLCLPSVWGALDEPALRAVLLAAGPCLLLGGILIGAWYKFVAAWLPARIATLVTGLGEGLRQLGARPRSFVELMFLGIAAQLVWILSAYVLGVGLDIELGFPAYVVMAGGATLFSVLPISLGGWGVREVGMVALFGAVGVAAEQALALSVLWGLLPALVSLPTGILWLVRSTPGGDGGAVKLAE